MTSLGQLERQAELQRARFVESVDDVRVSLEQTATKFRENLSPASVVRRSSAKWRELALKSVRDNPVQVASAAAFAVYPAWRLARVVPLPMVVAGLGVLFATKMRAAPMDRVFGETNKRAKEVAAKVADATTHLQDTATGRLNAAGAALQAVSRTVTETVGSRLSDAVDATGGAISSVSESVRPSGEALHVIRDGAQAAAASAVEIGSRTAASSSHYSREAIALLSKKPILVAATGIAVGSLLAALLPEAAGSEKVQARRQPSDAARMRMPK